MHNLKVDVILYPRKKYSYRSRISLHHNKINPRITANENARKSFISHNLLHLSRVQLQSSQQTKNLKMNVKKTNNVWSFAKYGLTYQLNSDL